MNDYMYEIAEQAAQAATDVGIDNIDPKWLYSQFCHESNDFTSQLYLENKNSGGLTQETDNGEENHQPDGGYWYKVFDTYEDYATFFGHYLKYFIDSGVDQATTMVEYITALKNSPSGAYFGDDIDNYIAGCEFRYNQAFGGND
jgi:hypothetical protein